MHSFYDGDEFFKSLCTTQLAHKYQNIQKVKFPTEKLVSPQHLLLPNREISLETLVVVKNKAPQLLFQKYTWPFFKFYY